MGADLPYWRGDYLDFVAPKMPLPIPIRGPTWKTQLERLLGCALTRGGAEFAENCGTWCSTVLTEMNNLAEISSLDRPSERRSRISCSRTVSPADVPVRGTRTWEWSGFQDRASYGGPRELPLRHQDQQALLTILEDESPLWCPTTPTRLGKDSPIDPRASQPARRHRPAVRQRLNINGLRCPAETPHP